MYCSKCGQIINENQRYCSHCGERVNVVAVSESNGQKKELVRVAANLIQRAFVIICCVSTSLTFFWGAIVNDRDLRDYIGVVAFVEFALIFMALSLLAINGRYKYNAAKVVILFSLLTAGEVVFLLLNTKNEEASAVVEIFFSILILIIYVYLKKEIKYMLEEENLEKGVTGQDIKCSELDHGTYKNLVKKVGENTTDGKWILCDNTGKMAYVCKHCNKVIANESEFVTFYGYKKCAVCGSIQEVDSEKCKKCGSKL